LAVYTLNWLVLIVQGLVDHRFQTCAGVDTAYQVTTFWSGIMASIFLLLVPQTMSATHILCMGALCSIASSIQLSSAMQLAAIMVEGGSMFVSLGFTLGSAFPIFMAPALGFTPGCNEMSLWLFFYTGSAIGMLCCTYWALVLNQARHRISQQLDVEAEQESIAGGLVRNAYGSLEFLASPPQSPPQGCVETTRSCWDRVLAPCLIFLCMFTGFALIPLFPMQGASTAQSLYLSKCLGDFLGRALAICQSTRAVDVQFPSTWDLVVALAVIAARTCLSAVILHQLLSNTHQLVPLELQVVFAYTAGGYAMPVIDLGTQLSVPNGLPRQLIQRWNMFVMFAAQIVGLIAGMSLLYGEDMVSVAPANTLSFQNIVKL